MTADNNEISPETVNAPVPSQKDTKPKRQRPAVEDLYDLSKPIPKVDKPNKAKHDEDVQAINSKIDALKESKNELQNKIESALNGGKSSAAGKEREALRALRAKKGKLIDEKKAMRAKLDLFKKQADNLMNDRKAAKANVRFSDAAAIDAEIAKLKQKQETTSMTLSEEKKLIKEIDALQTSKGVFSELKDKDSAIDNALASRKEIAASIATKDKEIDAVQKEIDEKQKLVDAQKDSDAEIRKNLSSLKAERDSLRKEIGEKIEERNKIRDEFQKENDKWYDYQRAIKAQKKLQYEEEKKKREEERLVYLAEKEAEEAKKIPYEEEQVLCDYLADYLTKTYLSEESKSEKEEKKADVVAVSDDPFAGLAPLKKDEDQVFLKMGAGKSKRNRATKKQAAKPAFKLNVDSFEQFGLLGLTPPTSFDAVQKSVEELRAKKVWYSQQPRGSVPTAADIRKANEKAAQKVKQADVPAPKKNGKLDIAGDEFAPLSTGVASSTLNSAWGKTVPSE
jgi:uncharacterized coiled-coil DUF342 family protein